MLGGVECWAKGQFECFIRCPLENLVGPILSLLRTTSYFLFKCIYLSQGSMESFFLLLCFPCIIYPFSIYLFVQNLQVTSDEKECISLLGLFIAFFASTYDSLFHFISQCPRVHVSYLSLFDLEIRKTFIITILRNATSVLFKTKDYI